MYDACFARTPPRSRRRTFVGPRCQDECHHRFAHDTERRDGRHVGAFLNETALSRVTTSTVSSTGRFSVESGFIATLAMIGAPEEIPPSVPPA